MTNAESNPVRRELQRQQGEREASYREVIAGMDKGHTDQEFFMPSQVQTADDLLQRLARFLSALDAQVGESHAAKLRRLVALDGQFQMLFREAITHQAEAIEHEASST